MAATKTTPTAVEAGRLAVVEARERLEHWTGEHAAAASELEDLQARSGEAALDKPGSLAAISKRIGEARDRVEVAARALEAQQARVQAAEVAYLLAEADALEAPVAAAEKVLAAHHRRTEELLEQLTEHEGPYVTLREHELATGEAPTAGLRSVELEEELERLKRGPSLLRELAAGRDPRAPLSEYPACVASDDALVKAGPYLRARQSQDELLRAIREERIPATERRRAEAEATLHSLKAELEKAPRAHPSDPRWRELKPAVRNEPRTLADAVAAADLAVEAAKSELDAAVARAVRLAAGTLGG